MSRALSIVLGVAVLLPGICAHGDYGFAPRLADTEWTFTGSRAACELSQAIPDFGRATFVRAAGDTLLLELAALRPLLAETAAVRITSRAPPWHPTYPAVVHLGEAKVVEGGVRVGEPLARPLLLALYAGLDTVFVAGEVEVVVSAVNFRPVFETYLDCFSGLSALAFKAVERTSIGYPSNGWSLSGDARLKLDKVADYTLGDPEVSSIFVDGHTDNAGTFRQNVNLSRKRAQTVTDYLIGRGVREGIIVTRYHGGRYPIADNDTEASRARNRRTTIRLERNG